MHSYYVEACLATVAGGDPSWKMCERMRILSAKSSATAKTCDNTQVTSSLCDLRYQYRMAVDETVFWDGIFQG